MQVENEEANVSSQPGQLYWWIAINGASAAMSSLPLPITVKCIPTPQQLLGFTDPDIAARAQHILLTAPVSQMESQLNLLLKDKDEVVIINPENPEPSTRGATVWLDGGGDGALAEGLDEWKDRVQKRR